MLPPVDKLMMDVKFAARVCGKSRHLSTPVEGEFPLASKVRRLLDIVYGISGKEMING